MRISAITNSMAFRNNTVKPSFRGTDYPSGDYSDEEIEMAKKFINQSGPNWRKQYKRDNRSSFKELYDANNGLNRILAPTIRPFCDDMEEAKSLIRVFVDAGTVFLWEVVNSPFVSAETLVKKLMQNNKLNKETQRLALLICDLKAKQEKDQIDAHIKNVNSIIENTEKSNRLMQYQKALKNGFIIPVEDEKFGKPAEIPNVIMIVGQDDYLNKDLINFVRKNSPTYYAFIQDEDDVDMMKKLDDKLDLAKNEYNKNGTRMLIEVDNFGKLIQKDNPFDYLEWMKSLMTSCADYNKATIIFKTDDSSNYSDEAIEPHRIGLKVNTNK